MAEGIYFQTPDDKEEGYDKVRTYLKTTRGGSDNSHNKDGTNPMSNKKRSIEAAFKSWCKNQDLSSKEASAEWEDFRKEYSDRLAALEEFSKPKPKVAAYDSGSKKGTGILEDGGNGYWYVKAWVPVKVGLVNDRDINPNLAGKLVQYEILETELDGDGDVDGITGEFVGKATVDEIEDFGGGALVDEMQSDPMMDMGPDPMMDLGPAPMDDPMMGDPLGDPMPMDDPMMGDPLMGDMGPDESLEMDLGPVPMDAPIASSIGPRPTENETEESWEFMRSQESSDNHEKLLKWLLNDPSFDIHKSNEANESETLRRTRNTGSKKAQIYQTRKIAKKKLASLLKATKDQINKINGT
jgi:hypothetical protein